MNKENIEEAKTFTNSQVQRLVAFFVASAIYGALVFAEFQYQKKELDVVEQRLNKKIKVLNELEARIIKLERNHESK